MGDIEILPGRSCGTCSLCCKLLRIDELNKPEGQWCSHCAPGRAGCLIYERRPKECQGFYCAWLTAADVGPEWSPLTSKMVLYSEGDGNRIAVHVEPSNPTAWRKEPYYSQLKKWAALAAEQSQQLVIYIKRRVIVLLPNDEADLGEMKRGDHIIVAATRTPLGKKWRAHIVPAKDITEDRKDKWTIWKKPS